MHVADEQAKGKRVDESMNKCGRFQMGSDAKQSCKLATHTQLLVVISLQAVKCLLLLLLFFLGLGFPGTCSLILTCSANNNNTRNNRLIVLHPNPNAGCAGASAASSSCSGRSCNTPT
jgi:hypothetical protein